MGGATACMPRLTPKVNSFTLVELNVRISVLTKPTLWNWMSIGNWGQEGDANVKPKPPFLAS